jgi:hypothetical protein
LPKPSSTKQYPAELLEQPLKWSAKTHQTFYARWHATSKQTEPIHSNLEQHASVDAFTNLLASS